jgi:4-aminobutyrate aminotransferase
VLRIAPPLSLTVAEAEEGAAVLETALKAAQAALENDTAGGVL